MNKETGPNQTVPVPVTRPPMPLPSNLGMFWLARPLAVLALAIATWPLLVGFLMLCARHHFSKWTAAIGVIVLILGGFTLSGLTVPRVWLPPGRKLAILVGSIFIWALVGKILRHTAFVTSLIDELTRLYK